MFGVARDKKLLEEYSIGDSAFISHIISEKDVEHFAELTGDFNPLHLDKEYANLTTFRKPVVYGMLSASFISTLIGMVLPGPGALWTSQTLEFIKQVYVGDEIIVKGVVKQISKATRTLVIDIKITNQKKEVVVSGQATVKLLEEEKKECEVMEENRMILITGGSRGIGAEIARKVANQGYIPIINYSKSSEEAGELCREITDSGKKAYLYQADISNELETRSMFAKISEELGDIYGIVHCAAPINNIKGFEQLLWVDIQNQLDVQLKGAYNCAKNLLPTLVERGIKGKYIVIGSIATDGTPPMYQTDYTLAKAALSAFAKSLAVEYSPKGISISIVSPGMTVTNRIADIPEKAKLLTKMQAPSRSLNDVKEIAETILFLLDCKSCAFTGETIRVCGGVVMV